MTGRMFTLSLHILSIRMQTQHHYTIPLSDCVRTSDNICENEHKFIYLQLTTNVRSLNYMQEWAVMATIRILFGSW